MARTMQRFLVEQLSLTNRLITGSLNPKSNQSIVVGAYDWLHRALTFRMNCLDDLASRFPCDPVALGRKH